MNVRLLFQQQLKAYAESVFDREIFLRRLFDGRWISLSKINLVMRYLAER